MVNGRNETLPLHCAVMSRHCDGVPVVRAGPVGRWGPVAVVSAVPAVVSAAPAGAVGVRIRQVWSRCALLQRNKGRDLVDLSHSLDIFGALNTRRLVELFGKYLDLSG